MDFQEALIWLASTSYPYELGKGIADAFEERSKTHRWDIKRFSINETLPEGWEPFAFDSIQNTILCKRHK